MKASVKFYRNVLGMELLYGGEWASFSSLRANDSQSAILNLEHGDSVSRWGRLIFHVADVDAFWTLLKEEGFDPEIPRDSSWGERSQGIKSEDVSIRRGNAEVLMLKVGKRSGQQRSA